METQKEYFIDEKIEIDRKDKSHKNSKVVPATPSKSNRSSFTQTLKKAFKKESKKGKKDKNKKLENMETESHPKCGYCKGHFDQLSESEVQKKKYKIRKFLDGKQTKKEEEYFRMCILSYQMMNQNNKRMTALDPEILYNNAQSENVPFYQYNEWVTKKGTQVLFEGMFLQKYLQTAAGGSSSKK